MVVGDQDPDGCRERQLNQGRERGAKKGRRLCPRPVSAPDPAGKARMKPVEEGLGLN